MGQVTQNGSAPLQLCLDRPHWQLETTQFVIHNPNAALTYRHGPFFSVLTDSA